MTADYLLTIAAQLDAESPHVIEITARPSEMYEDTTAYVAECSCGWRVTRYSANRLSRSVALHQANAAPSTPPPSSASASGAGERAGGEE